MVLVTRVVVGATMVMTEVTTEVDMGGKVTELDARRVERRRRGRSRRKRGEARRRSGKRGGRGS